jgi:hypothetical protein
MTLRYLRCVQCVRCDQDAGTARCVIMPSQLTGSAVSEGQVVFSVLFTPRLHSAVCLLLMLQEGGWVKLLQL